MHPCLLKLLNKFYVPHSLRIYTSFVRLHLEYTCVWHPGISHDESEKIESIQKRALRIILKEAKVPYSLLLKKTKLETLEHRTGTVCLHFAKDGKHFPQKTLPIQTPLATYCFWTHSYLVPHPMLKLVLRKNLRPLHY